MHYYSIVFILLSIVLSTQAVQDSGSITVPHRQGPQRSAVCRRGPLASCVLARDAQLQAAPPALTMNRNATLSSTREKICDCITIACVTCLGLLLDK